MEKIGDLSEISGERIIEWKVKDYFSLRDAIDASYESPDFHFFGITWFLRLYPNGHTSDGSAGWIGIYLNRLSSGSPVTLDYWFTLKSTDRSKDHAVKAIESIFAKQNTGKGFNKLISRSVLIDRKADLVPSDEITIICTLKNVEPVILSPTAVTGKSYIAV